MRSVPIAAVAAILSVASATAQDHDPDKAIANGGNVVEGWKARPDRGSLENLDFRTMGSGYHVTVGPAVILYQDETMASGSYTASGSFTQTSSLGHAHGYGLIIGGQDLQGAGQQYTYFLVRGDGVFLIKKRNGTELSLVSEGNNGWSQHDAITVEDADGKATNELAIRVGASDVSFLVNGKEVHRAPKSAVDTDGIVGMRINHNLDIHIGSLSVEH
jgi:hypothetical protein